MTEATRDPIRVLIVDDSATVLAVLERILAVDPGIRVVGTAADGRAALEQVARLRPDVVCTDLQMPVMDGLAFTREVMARQPTPVLVVSVAVHDDQQDNVFAALDAGAVDVFPKPAGGLRVDSAEADALRRRVRVVAGVHVFRRRPRAAPNLARPTRRADPAATAYRVVAVGASTGGPRGLAAILGALPPDFPLPVLVVQHIGHGFAGALTSWLAGVSGLDVRLAHAGEQPVPGVAYFPPEGRHLVLDAAGTLQTPAEGAPTTIPSVDVLFSSLARTLGGQVIAVLLSGMGTDGAAGMRELADLGALTIAQDEETSVVYGMPGAAVRLGAVHEVLPIGEIAPYLIDVGHRVVAASGRSQP